MTVECIRPYEGNAELRKSLCDLEHEIDIEARAVQRAHVDRDRRVGQVFWAWLGATEILNVNSVRDQ